MQLSLIAWILLCTLQSSLVTAIPSLRVGPRQGLIFSHDLPDGFYTAPIHTSSQLSKTHITPNLIQPLNTTDIPSATADSSFSSIRTRAEWWSNLSYNIGCKPPHKINTDMHTAIRAGTLKKAWKGYVNARSVSGIKLGNTIVYLCNYSDSKVIFPDPGRYEDIDQYHLDEKCGERVVGWMMIDTSAQAYGRELTGREICGTVIG
ncbi:hypothetical protein BJ508DRAFT_413059 [Ascobolus immersus RN42]|uniref:Uncharacterized protein n=1 Tax=Ascobolus immersus RN42 TaxID=1160509 RepID=A0A3N4IR27_ASCIM|nr:hypothetical protein BJ508DRAFT_413059 [Ascobolus immersus RN42]